MLLIHNTKLLILLRVFKNFIFKRKDLLLQYILFCYRQGLLIFKATAFLTFSCVKSGITYQSGSNETIFTVAPLGHPIVDHSQKKYYAHTNRFCVVQENIKPEDFKYRPSLRYRCIETKGFIFSCTTAKLV